MLRPSFASPLRNAVLRVAALALTLCASLVLALCASRAFAQSEASPPELLEGYARIHYQRPAGDYDGWVLHLWEDTLEEVTWQRGLPISGRSDYGVYWDLRLREGASRVGFIVHLGDLKDPGPDMFLRLDVHGREIWLQSGSDRILTERPLAPPASGVARLHYHRPDGLYDGWVLHLWEDTLEEVTWQAGLPASGRGSDGVYWDLRLRENPRRVGFIVHRGDEKDPGPDMFLEFERLTPGSAGGFEAWVVSGSATVHPARPDLRSAGGGDLSAQRAYFVDRDLILWDVGLPIPGAIYTLHHAADASLRLAGEVLEGGERIDLTYDPNGPPAEVLRKFPHLAGLSALRLHPRAHPRVPELLRGQLAVSLATPTGVLLDATGLQIPGVIDALFTTDAPLGVQRVGEAPRLSLWAPTARSVELELFEGEGRTTLPMLLDAASGVWSILGEPSWWGRDYLYAVDVFVPTSGRFERNVVTDPYAISLRMNSARSQLIDLDDPALMPEGWSALVKAPLADPVDAVVYELHVRDFSVRDAAVPEELRGTYRAFTVEGAGRAHLRALAEAGLTHLHLLPTFDIATIDEDRSTWLEPEVAGVAFPSRTAAVAEAVEAVRDRDAFNWGYDPWHFFAPEGSYATDPDGPARILEFREMVMALDGIGLRVVVDVVFNHTHAAGQGERSVLDRVVPGYYHRLDAAGRVHTSSCCPNTATEHAMMERLMLDAVELWARAYKVDGFRFDLMGHHMVENMLRVRERLATLTPAADGVHGEAVLLYGEGWNFGEVADNARGLNATQLNLAGSGIGTFSDRLRDAVRGGGPFDQGDTLVRAQGFATGLGTMPNSRAAVIYAEAERAAALRAADLVRLGLAGNLAAFEFENADGEVVRGDQIAYHDQPAGYARVPQDHVVYVSKHDNQTLWDIAQYKLPGDLSTELRVRAHLLALSTVLYAQGVPFLHAGSDLLRSKSFDRNSYDSGDLFNAIDWTGATHTFGLGVPLPADNRASWFVMRDRLENPLLRPSQGDILFAAAVVQDMLRLRRDTPLLRLRSAEEVHERLSFHATGPEAPPGVIVMQLRDDLPAAPNLDPAVDRLLVVFNAAPEALELEVPEVAGRRWSLHPQLRSGADRLLLEASVDAASGVLRVPGLSTVVFIAEGAGGR